MLLSLENEREPYVDETDCGELDPHMLLGVHIAANGLQVILYIQHHSEDIEYTGLTRGCNDLGAPQLHNGRQDSCGKCPSNHQPIYNSSGA